jgi:N-glycosylase/DNA lyase
MSIEKPSREYVATLRQIVAKTQASDSLKRHRLALDHARTGDWSYLTAYLRRNGSVTSEMRALIVDILEKCSRAKIGGKERKDRKYKIVEFILEARSRGERERDYSRRAEEKFRQTWRHLRRALEDKELRETVLAHRRFVSTFNKAVEPLRHYGGDDRHPPHTYVVNTDTALTPHTVSPLTT